MDPDILAVQEVDGAAALQRVVDTDVYDVHVSSRLQGSVGKQNTGFAYRKGRQVRPQPDVTTLNTSGGLRHGARIDLTHNGRTLKLMSVHLKSGCFSNTSSGAACASLMAQIPPLEQWIDTAAAGAEPFIVLGDFNRRFNEPGDQVWSEIDDAIPPNADLTAITQDMPISCRDNAFDQFIDHIVFDARAIAWVEWSSFRQMTYRQGDKAVWGQISDHCPVMVEMWIE
jgi:endonuclease/exonuclease/phosphatase family metal-dependent hydrolase